MKKVVLILGFLIFVNYVVQSQVDTVSINLYQKDGNIGIGTDDPLTNLHVKNDKPRIVAETNEGEFIRIGCAYGGSSITFNRDKKLYIEAREDYLTGNETSGGIVVQGDGNIGIGTTEPSAKLEVSNGDIYISDIEKGIIMKSSDGNCWRGVLDNTGQLNFSLIDCPVTEISKIEPQIEQVDNIILFPNPSENIINIKLANNITEKLRYEIYNLSGQLEDKGKIKSDLDTINISNLIDGTYLINILDSNKNKIASKKFLKN